MREYVKGVLDLMRKWNRIVSLILVFCLTFSLMGIDSAATESNNPVQANGQEVGIEGNVENDSEEESIDKLEEEVEESEAHTNEEKSEEEQEQVVDKQRAKSNVVEAQGRDEKQQEDLPGEQQDVDEDADPQMGRAQGKIPGGFYGGVSSRASSVQHDSRFDGYTIEKGIDVSKHNGSINWSKVKAAGIDFALIRVAYRGYGSSGSLNIDNKGIENIKEALAAKIPVGVYIFSQALSEKEAEAEANYVLDILKENGFTAKDITLPIVMDFEFASAGNGEEGRLYDLWEKSPSSFKTTATKSCIAFCKTIEAAGYTPMVYANRSMLTSNLNASQISQNYQIWLAHYTNKTDYKGEYTYWQYTSSGKVNGISGNVDLDFRYLEGENSQVIGLKSVEKTKNSVTLSWNPVDNADGYEIYRKAGSSYKKIGSVNGEEVTDYTDGSLESGVSYSYKVRSYTGEGDDIEYGDFSKVLTVVTKVAEPKLSIKAGEFGGVVLSWDKVSNASGYVVERYSFLNEKWTTLKTITSSVTLSYTNSNLYSDTKYRYRVKAYINVNSEKEYGDYSEVKDITTPSFADGSFTVTGETIDRVRLSWDKVDNVTGYEIQRYSFLRDQWEILETITGSSVVSCVDSNLYPDTTYKYRVRAFRGTGEEKEYGDYSKAKETKTLAFGEVDLQLQAEVSNRVDLSWNQIENVTGYEVDRYSFLKGKWETLEVLEGDDKVTYSNENLYPNTKYRYRVRAYKEIGKNVRYSDYSEVMDITTPKPDKVVLKLQAKEFGGNELSWKKVANVTGYEVERYSFLKSTWETLKTIQDDDITTYTNDGLYADTLYRYRVRCYKKVSTSRTEYSDYSDIKDVTTPRFGDGTFEVNGKTVDKVEISWGEVTGASGYEIQRYSFLRERWESLKNVNGDKTVATDEGLYPDTTYKYRVRAYKTVGSDKLYGYFSEAKSTKTLDFGKVTLSLKADTFDKVRLSWNQIDDVTGYEVQRYSFLREQWESLKKISGDNKTSYSNTGLYFTTTYKYRVRAYKTIGGNTRYSEFSEAVSIKTPECLLDTPVLKFSEIHAKSIKMSWNKITNASGYHVQRYSFLNKKWETLKTITSGSTTSYTNENLYADTTYKYRVRAYRKGGNKTAYSDYSEAKSTKTKKTPTNEWVYEDGYKFYYGSNGKIKKDVSSIIGKQSSYVIKVNKKKNVVTVYAKDGSKGYIIPVKSMICSAGNATPIGTYNTQAKYRWRTLIGPCYGQWCTRIVDGFLFHSVYYNSYNNNKTLSVSAYNKLGTTCSHGCVRLTAGDAKWIYDNCKLKTKVVIYSSSDPGPFGKPTAYKLSSSHTWDPTDPNMKYKCRERGCHI